MDPPLQEDFDISRYQGLWYDVARFPQFFDMNTPWETAYYTLKSDENGSYIKVHNTAYHKDGCVKNEIIGRADIVDSNQPAALYVSFPHIFSFLFGNPNVANYLIHATDYENYAIVGSYNKKSLYILSRQRPMSREFYNDLLDYVESLGYDITHLQEDYESLSA